MHINIQHDLTIGPEERELQKTPERVPDTMEFYGAAYIGGIGTNLISNGVHKACLKTETENLFLKCRHGYIHIKQNSCLFN